MLKFMSLLRARGWKFALNCLFPELRFVLNHKVLPFVFLSAVGQRCPKLYKLLLPDVQLSKQPAYCAWLYRNYPRKAALSEYRTTLSSFSCRPLISIIMPVYNTPGAYLRHAIDSVLAQVYPCFELCIVDDASPSADIWPLLQQYAEQDSRIRVARRDTNGGIAAASNAALELATGEFIAQLDHDDALAPHALYRVAALLNRYPDVDVIYSDEDKIDENEMLADPFFKPAWSPDTFLSQMYTCHFAVYRRALIAEVGGFRSAFDGAEDYDLVLRLTERARRIEHIADVLYHWRSHPGSAAGGPDGAKVPALCAAACRSLEETLDRRNAAGTVANVSGLPGSYKIRYSLKTCARVKIFIDSSSHPGGLRSCLSSIFNNARSPEFSITVIHHLSAEEHGSISAETPGPLLWEYTAEADLAETKNRLASETSEQYVLFLSSALGIASEEFLEVLVGHAAQRHIGACGPLALDADDRVRHAGVLVGVDRGLAYSHFGAPYGAPGYYGHLRTVTNYSALSGDCLICERTKFIKAGGFRPDFDEPYRSADLCLRLRKTGYSNVCVPQAVARYLIAPPDVEPDFIAGHETFLHEWRDVIDNDPCYSPHLTRRHGDYRMRIYD